MNRTEKEHILEQLKLEREFIHRGGYRTSVRTRRKPPTHLRDSVTCINVNVSKAKEMQPCDRCFWWDLIPTEHRHKRMPCRYIPLDEEGNTVESLDERGDREQTEGKLSAWLDTTIARLEQELGNR